MLASDRGIGRTSGATENDSPTACPGVGYGSCPTISTRASANGRVKARSTFGPAGRYRRPAAISARRNSPICATTGSTGASARAHPGLLDGALAARVLRQRGIADVRQFGPAAAVGIHRDVRGQLVDDQRPL